MVELVLTGEEAEALLGVLEESVLATTRDMASSEAGLCQERLRRRRRLLAEVVGLLDSARARLDDGR